MTAAPSARPVVPVAASEVGSWLAEADVVIVGYGVSGAAAAAEAVTHGADVLVLEWTGGWGGAAAMAAGEVYLGGGTALQRACGFDDAPEEMYKFLVAALGPGVDDEKVRVYSEESVDHFDWLVRLGVDFKAEFFDQPAVQPPGDQGLMFTGGENSWPFNEIAKPAPRGHLPRLPAGASREQGGSFLLRPMIDTAERGGAKTVYDVRVDRLVVERDGSVAGVAGTRYGEPVYLRARHAVVLATGGFVYNDDMMARFAPHLLRRPVASVEQHDGQAIRMAQAIGADLGRMDGCEAAITTAPDPSVLCRGILVNRFGQRFMPEDAYHGRVAQTILFKQDDEAFFVIDQIGFEDAPPLLPGMGRERQNPDWVCETVAELEAEMGIPDGGLVSAVELFNRHAADGNDPFFHKNAKWLRPLESPFAAFDLRHVTRGFTLGGLRTNVAGEVIHVSGDPIPGLYAAGRVTSGLPVWGYASGTSLGDGSFFGRRAGRSAATRAARGGRS